MLQNSCPRVGSDFCIRLEGYSKHVKQGNLWGGLWRACLNLACESASQVAWETNSCRENVMGSFHIFISLSGTFDDIAWMWGKESGHCCGLNLEKGRSPIHAWKLTPFGREGKATVVDDLGIFQLEPQKWNAYLLLAVLVQDNWFCFRCLWQ